MQLSYELSSDDLVKAQRLFLRRKRAFFYWGFPIYGVVVLLFGVFVALNQSAVAALPALFFSAYLILLPTLILPLGAKGVWNQTPSLRGPTTLKLAPEGFEISNPLSRALVRGVALQSSVQDARMWMLFLGPGSYYLVPKRALETPQQAQEFEQIVAKFIAMNAPDAPISAP